MEELKNEQEVKEEYQEELQETEIKTKKRMGLRDRDSHTQRYYQRVRI